MVRLRFDEIPAHHCARVVGVFLGETLHGGHSAVLLGIQTTPRARWSPPSFSGSRSRSLQRSVFLLVPLRRVQLAGHAQASNNSQQLPTRSPARAGAVSSFGLVARAGLAFDRRGFKIEMLEMLLLVLIIVVIVGTVVLAFFTAPNASASPPPHKRMNHWGGDERRRG
jgi:hypothetical protein